MKSAVDYDYNEVVIHSAQLVKCTTVKLKQRIIETLASWDNDK